MCHRAIWVALFAVLYAAGCKGDGAHDTSGQDAGGTTDHGDGASDVSNQPDRGPDTSDRGDGAPDSNPGSVDGAPDTDDLPDTGALCQPAYGARPVVTVSLSDGGVESNNCNSLTGPGSARTFSGVVRDDQQNPAARTSLTIDTCAGGCTVNVSVTNSIPFAIPVGAYVEVAYSFTSARFVCKTFLRISNLPAWNGQSNPVSDSSDPYLIVSANISTPEPEHLASTGLGIELVPTGCVVVDGGGHPCGTYLLRTWAYQFSHPSSAPVTVMQGTEQPWLINGRSFVVRNQQSFTTGACDSDFTNWSFTIAAR